MLSLFVGGPAELRRYAGDAPVLTDDRMSLEFSAPREIHRRSGGRNGAALLALRRTLLREEWAEVQAEFDDLAPRLDTAGPEDLAPLVHELVDLLYVTYGALDLLGVDADAAFAEVQRANLSKASGPKRADGKQLKPEGWQPANLRAVLEQLKVRPLE